LEGPVTVRLVPVTVTGTVAVAPAAVAVTVMVRLVGSPAALKVATAVPVAAAVFVTVLVPPVVATSTANPPELAEKVTGTSLTS